MSELRRPDPLHRPEIRWTVGCLIAMAALVGSLVLLLLVAIALQPPAWVQVVAGVGLALGGALLAWLIANALGQARTKPGPRGLAGGEETPRRRASDRIGPPGGS